MNPEQIEQVAAAGIAMTCEKCKAVAILSESTSVQEWLNIIEIHHRKRRHSAKRHIFGADFARKHFPKYQLVSLEHFSGKKA